MTHDADAGRIFVAAVLPDSLREAIRLHLDGALHGRALPGRTVVSQNWHLTLRFLGDTSRDELGAVCDALATEDLGPSFDVGFTRLGAFPTPARARVLWLGTGDGADRLCRLAEVVEKVARSAGFAPEPRPFRPHLTLSRIKPDGDVRALLAAVPPLEARARVDEVVVFRSHLAPSGPRYEAVRRFRLYADGAGRARTHDGPGACAGRRD